MTPEELQAERDRLYETILFRWTSAQISSAASYLRRHLSGFSPAPIMPTNSARLLSSFLSGPAAALARKRLAPDGTLMLSGGTT